MSSDSLVGNYLETLRLRLIDLSGRNRLLNFKFSERSRTQVRIIDELPDQVFETLEKGKSLTIISLPEPPEHPTDEDDSAFLLLLEAMRDTDEEYMAAIATLDEADQDSDEFQQIERKLRDKVREELEMPPRTDVASLSKAAYAEHLGINPDYELPTLESEEGGKPAHRDKNLQSLLYPVELERKLAGLREGARKSIQELGLNTLYLAFGMLEWYEAEKPDKRCFAPLLLCPVALERQLRNGQYRYTLKSYSGEPEENFSLRERLKRDFGIVLPSFTAEVDEEGQVADTPESYFEKIKHVIRDRPRWKVRRFLTLSLFSFGGIALYQDLNPERWPDHASILTHPLVSSILCGQDEVSQEAIAPDHDVDHPSIASKVPILITDADASQFSAIVDAVDGQNLVIEGPPGTGKSQTITNLIAVALAKNKKVLFVAEKKAALDVVYNRLANAGLENYCLDVHSTATSRQAFYGNLKQRVEQDLPPNVAQELEIQIQDCSQLKQQLSSYVSLLNQAFGQSGKTIQELLWASQRSTDLMSGLAVPSALTSLRDERAIAMTENDLQRTCQHLREFSGQHQGLVQEHGHVNQHPWFGLTAHDLSPIDQGDLCTSAKTWSGVLKQIQAHCQHIISQLNIEQPTTLSELTQLQQQLESCPEIPPYLEASLLPALKTPQVQDATLSLIHQIKEYRRNIESLNQYFEDGIQDGTTSFPDPGDLRALLTRLQDLGIDQRDYTVSKLEIIGQQATETRQNLEKYRPIANQVASFFDWDASPDLTDIDAISTLVQFLSDQSSDTLAKRTPELCDPSNRATLLKARETCEQLKSLKTELTQKYYLDACENAGRMNFYANKLRHANILTHLFDSDYHQAKKLWKKIQKRYVEQSDSGIASAFEKIARFKEQLSHLQKDSNLQRICGQYFRELETDFDALLAVNTLAREAAECLSSYPQGQRLTTFLIQADNVQLEKVNRLQKSSKFQALLTFVDSLKSDKEIDDQQTWEELETRYEELSSGVTYAFESLKNAGLKSSFSILEMPTLIQRIEDLESAKQQMATSEAINVLGYFYDEERTDIERLEATTHFAKSVVRSQLPQSLQDQLLTKDAALLVEPIQTASQQISNQLDQESKHRQAFFQQGKPNAQEMFGGQYVTNLEMEHIIARLDQLITASEELPTWINYHRAYQRVVDDGLAHLIEAFEAENLPLENLETIYQSMFYRSLLRFAYQQHPELSQFSGITQTQAREQFRQADEKLISLYRKQLAAQLAQVWIEPGNSRGRKSEYTNLALIRNEINKQRRHISQRDLFQRASVALQQLKPCWMMSPASVAQFIPPDATTFDMVIIDEASQMRPEEALGAIARSKQLVVVGDPKQLPPTDFFKTHVDHEFEDGSGDESDVLDDESILDMSLKIFYPARRLKWHYRSRHESLIAFSNSHFYDNSLTIFPSPNNQFAVEYRYVESGAYRSGANVPEAMTVAEAAVEFMRCNPHLSLGIVTLNQKQQELLLDEVDRLCAIHPELDQYRTDRENTLEPFFVKNLENVQGDERDVIFISTVYGPERPGMSVHQRFGPINSRSGHRRLNVLFTRAKERIVVFSSMQSSDIRPSPTSNRGVHILKEYLDYAQTQRIQTAVSSGREPDSDFEVFVADRLRQHGYEVEPQVGVSGYFIDLAVIDPERPGTYLLGVECDGATYHSSKAARDRDRLRQQVLERLGWNLYRIWSTDWFSKPGAETEKLIRYIQTIQAGRG